MGQNQKTTPWQADGELAPGGLRITSPYDVEARYSRKKSTPWTGDIRPFDANCEADRPHLIVEVTTTASTTPDGDGIMAFSPDFG